MNDREKLEELLWTAIKELGECYDAPPEFAEYLITKGVVIQKQGEWICTETYRWGDVYSCSKCGFEMDEELRTDYCPNCGAKMKEVK